MGQRLQVKAVDTNIIIRRITRDDPVQTPLADQIIASGPILLATTVLMECEWVLRSRYGYPRALIASALSRFLDVETIVAADPAGFQWAIERYADGADFADMLHLVTTREASAFVTFDGNIARFAKAGDQVVETV